MDGTPPKVGIPEFRPPPRNVTFLGNWHFFGISQEMAKKVKKVVSWGTPPETTNLALFEELALFREMTVSGPHGKISTPPLFLESTLGPLTFVDRLAMSIPRCWDSGMLTR